MNCHYSAGIIALAELQEINFLRLSASSNANNTTTNQTAVVTTMNQEICRIKFKKKKHSPWTNPTKLDTNVVTVVNKNAFLQHIWETKIHHHNLMNLLKFYVCVCVCLCMRRWVALSTEDAEFFCNVETDLLRIIYIHLRLRKVKVQITHKLTSEEKDVDLL